MEISSNIEPFTNEYETNDVDVSTFTLDVSTYPIDVSTYMDYVIEDMSKAEKLSKASKYIWRVFGGIFITIGTVGNILSFIVMNRKKLRSSVASLYFR